MFDLRTRCNRMRSFVIGALLILVGVIHDDVQASCDANLLKRLASQALTAEGDLIHLAVYQNGVVDARSIRVSPGRGYGKTPAEITDILNGVADGRSPVFFNPNDQNQVWVQVRNGDLVDYHVYTRSVQRKTGPEGPYDEITYSYGGGKADVPPGMKEVYPELLTGAENARELARFEALTAQAKKLDLPSGLGGRKMQDFSQMSNEELARFISENRSVPFIPDPRSREILPYACGDQTCVVDAFKNVWRTGPSRTKGDLFEWDVTLKDKNSWLAQVARDGGYLHQGKNGTVYLNVSLSGRISH